MNRRFEIFVITALTALVSLNLFFIALTQGWFGLYEGAGCGFCERMQPGLIKQPANTWSNLGFVVAGLSMAWSLSAVRFQSNKNALTQSTLIATVFCCCAVLMGPASMAMHASGTKWGGFIDVLGMYLIASFLVSYSARRIFRFKMVYMPIIFTLVLSICIWAKLQRGFHLFNLSMGNTAFAMCLLGTAVLETYAIFAKGRRQGMGWGIASLCVMLLAFFIWNMSRTGNAWCDPDSLIQGHAAWHLLDAVSMYCLFRYYVSENENGDGAEVLKRNLSPSR